MKLWQKVFLITVTFFIAAAEVLSFVVLYTSFNEIVDRERERAVQNHGYVAQNIRSTLAYRRLDSGKILLSPDEIVAVIEGIISEKQAGDVSIYVYSYGESIGGGKSDILDENQEFAADVSSSDDFLTLITPSGEETYLVVGSPLSFDGDVYTLFTVSDITSLYTEYGHLFQTVQIFSIVFAIVLAAMLIIIFLRLLSPLKKVNSSLKELAGGNYKVRLVEDGSPEFRELKKNINIMAESVDENTEKIEAIAESRKQFIDNFAHEMKTPLTSIMGFADIMRIKRTLDDKKRQEYSGLIVEEAKRLKTLSSKLLELATADSASLDFEDVAVRQLFEEVYTSVIPILLQNKMTMSVTLTDATVKIDKELFKSLLYNLIDNAVKASKEGDELNMACRVVKNRALISVSDNGIGMSRDIIKKVTEPFFMADKARSRSRGGVGLGLALCSDIAKRHGAVLKITSKPGEGTTVTVAMRIEGSEKK